VSSTPIILVAHGSPHPRWRVPLDDLCRTLQRDGRIARLALLTEPDSLSRAVAEIRETGRREAVVIPALLCRGRHLDEDIPAWVERVSAEYPSMRLSLDPRALAERDTVVDALARELVREIDASESDPPTAD
jgi:sirohydrochlorin ferrochelatase